MLLSCRVLPDAGLGRANGMGRPHGKRPKTWDRSQRWCGIGQRAEAGVRCQSVGPALTREALQDLGDTVGVTLAALGAGLQGQSQAKPVTGGNRCILETVGCLWTWKTGGRFQKPELRTCDELDRREGGGNGPGSAPPGRWSLLAPGVWGGSSGEVQIPMSWGCLGPQPRWRRA